MHLYYKMVDKSCFTGINTGFKLYLQL